MKKIKVILRLEIMKFLTELVLNNFLKDTPYDDEDRDIQKEILTECNVVLTHFLADTNGVYKDYVEAADYFYECSELMEKIKKVKSINSMLVNSKNQELFSVNILDLDGGIEITLKYRENHG